MKVFKIVSFIGITAVTPAIACDLCAVYSATQARGESCKGPFIGAAEQFTHFGTLQLDGREVSNPTGQYLDSSITQLLVGYGLTERFSVQLNVPLIHRSFKRPEGFQIDRGTESGLGDVSLLGNFLAWRKDTEDFTFTWNLLGGVKFPTGDTGRLKEELNEVEVEGAPESGIHGHDLTLGSGSFDGIIGTDFYLRYQRAFLAAGVQYAIRSEGDFDYRFANDLTWSGGPGYYLMLNHEYSVALQINVSGEYKELDTFCGEKAADTGVTAVYLGPQLTVSWTDRFSAVIAADLPVSIDNTALQSVPEYRIRAAVTWRF